jgi:hypothetical protein
VPEQAAEAVFEARIPLIPVMSAGNDVEFVGKMPFFQEMSEGAVGGEQAFCVAAG